MPSTANHKPTTSTISPSSRSQSDIGAFGSCFSPSTQSRTLFALAVVRFVPPCLTNTARKAFTILAHVVEGLTLSDTSFVPAARRIILNLSESSAFDASEGAAEPSRFKTIPIPSGRGAGVGERRLRSRMASYVDRVHASG